MYKKYSFLLEAFQSDYWKNTKAVFEYECSSDNVNDLIRKYKEERYVPDFRSHSKSYYFFSPDKTKLVRISDHWSDSNIPGIKKCGYIGKCYWILHSKNKIENPKKYSSGICDMIKITKI